MSRKRYVYTEGGQPLPEPYEVSDDWSNAELRAPHATEELVYGNLQATDGTPINTRRRHREYMKANGLTLADDFKGTWEKAAKERESYRKGQAKLPGLRETLGRAEYEVSKRRRRG